MKKLLIVEIVALVLLVAAAVIFCMDLIHPDTLAESTADTTETTQTQSTFRVVTPEGPAITWKLFPGRELACKQFFVYDCTYDVMTAQYGDGNKLYPASITKLFSAYTALQFLSPATKITADDALSLVLPDSSIAFIKKGDTLTVEQLVEAMMLPSGNDAAYILAVSVGRLLANDRTLNPKDAANRFVQQMNDTAKRVGMTGSHFMNPDGYHHDDHYTSFADLAILGELVSENKTIVKYTGLAVGNNPNVDEENFIPQWKNTNLLIHPESEYYCALARGLKTGQTSQAGKCLLSAFDYEGHKMIIGVFGCPEMDDRFADTLQIFTRVSGSTK